MDTNVNPKNEREIGILDLIYAIVQKKRFVIIFTMIFAIGAIIYTLVTPKKWISTATIQPITENSSSMSINSGILDMLGGGGILPNAKEDLSMQFVTIMESRTFREDVIRKFDLIHYLKITKPDSLIAMELALISLKTEMVSISVDPQLSIITISIETLDKQLSQRMAQYYIQKLDNYNKFDKLSKSRMKRQFLEKNTLDIRTKIDSLGMAIRDFQSKYHAIDPDQQTQSIIGLYSEAVTTLMQTNFEYEIAKLSFSMDSPQMVALQKKKELVTERVKDLESKHSELNPKYLLQIDAIPDLTLRFAQLKMNLEIQKKIFEYLYPQYEAAKIEELRDMPSMEIIDSPNLAGLKSKPKRALTVILVTLAAFILACVLSIILVFSSESQKSLFRSIITELSFKHKN